MDYSGNFNQLMKWQHVNHSELLYMVTKWKLNMVYIWAKFETWNWDMV